MKKSTEELSLLTEQEISEIALNYSLPYSTESFARAIEAEVIAKIKAQGAVAFISPNVAAFLGIGTGVGEFSYVKTENRTIPLYHLPEGD